MPKHVLLGLDHAATMEIFKTSDADSKGIVGVVPKIQQEGPGHGLADQMGGQPEPTGAQRRHCHRPIAFFANGCYDRLMEIGEKVEYLARPFLGTLTRFISCNIVQQVRGRRVKTTWCTFQKQRRY